MIIDWLKSLRSSAPPRRRISRRLAVPTPLESRTLLSAVPLGPEFQVNTWTTDGQLYPAIAMDSDGDYVITWNSYGQDGSNWGIFAQRYNSVGIPQGAEFQVNSFTTSAQYAPNIAMDADGDFVITWESFAQDGNGDGVYARRYNALGIPQGSEFQVNSFTTDDQNSPSIAMDADGDFVITWVSYGQDGDDYGIYAQKFDAFGVPQGVEFRVNSEPASAIDYPQIGMDADGDFVITWTGRDLNTYAQRFNALGVPQGDEFHVGSTTTEDQWISSVGMDADGDFVVAWANFGGIGADGIYAQRFDATGVMQGSEFLVTSFTTFFDVSLSVGMDADGDFVVAWSNFGLDEDGYGCYAQRFNAAGVPQGAEFHVNSWTTGNQGYTSIAMDADGDFVITWESFGQDGFFGGIYSQRFSLINSSPLLNNAGNPTLDPLVQNKSLASNNGTLVADIIASMGPSGGITDADSDPIGIAINGVSNTYGSWQYTVNNGTNWTPITVTGNNNALLLASDGNTRIRFLPNADFIGNTRFAFVAWDRTTGANGGTANVAARGGTTPYSLAYEYASINVVNVAPVLDPAGSPTLDTIVSNLYNVDNPGTLVSDIIARMAPSGGITDANPGALQGIAINGLLNTDKGSWQFTTNGGTSWISIGTTGNSDARLLAADANTRIRFVPIAGFAGTASFAFVAWDRTSGYNGAVTGAGTRGGSTPYSLTYDYASISVVNAAPVLNDAGNPLFDGLLPDTPDASNPGTLV
ncbi:MAG: hypothetical protein KDA68_18495, partial [Planctomycetaceae bacterium]|nr:hypothetical protein [Planctomycetaceae bacterium]